MRSFSRLLSSFAIVSTGLAASPALADRLFHSRVVAVFEKNPGDFRDVFDIFVATPDNGLATRLTTVPPDTEFDSSGAREEPGGSRLVFDTMRHRLQNGNNAEIYLMNADGSGQTRMTTNSGVFSSEPDWCNGKILFAREDSAATSPDLYIMDAVDANSDGNGDNLTALVQTSAQEFSPACSPDGSKIAYISADANNDRKIVVSNSDGSNPLVLTSNPAICSAPAWSADGTWIYYACDHHDPQTFKLEIYRMRPTDTTPADGEGDMRERLTTSPAGVLADTPQPSPDGTRFAFTRTLGPTNAAFWQTVGAQDPTPIPGVAGRSFVSDWQE